MNKRVLIIDDETDTAEFMKRKLSRFNFDSWYAANGQEGLNMVQSVEPDVIVTDIVMPGMDGYTFCQKLHQIGAMHKIPVIVLTAFANRIVDFKGLGVQEFLVKPFDGDKLLEVIERVLKDISAPAQEKCAARILFQGCANPGIETAVAQFHHLGFAAKVKLIGNETDLIEEALKVKPDILIFDASRKDIPAHKIIRALRSYVILRKMLIMIYMKEKNKKSFLPWKKNSKELEEITQLCLGAGASRCLESLDKDTFLSILMENCKI